MGAPLGAEDGDVPHEGVVRGGRAPTDPLGDRGEGMGGAGIAERRPGNYALTKSTADGIPRPVEKVGGNAIRKKVVIYDAENSVKKINVI